MPARVQSPGGRLRTRPVGGRARRHGPAGLAAAAAAQPGGPGARRRRLSWRASPAGPGPARAGARRARPGMATAARKTVPFRAMSGFGDDLPFAHVLADAADDITMRRFRALDLRVDAKPDLTPVTRRRPGHRGGAAQHAAPGPATGRDARRGVRPDRLQPAVLGDRPHRRHQELCPRCPGLGHADRPDGRRRGHRGRGDRPGAGPPLVGGQGRPGLDRAQPDQGHQLPGLPGGQPGRRVDLLLEPVHLAGRGAAGRLPGPGPVHVAIPCLRGLLVAHAGRRGRGRHLRRDRRQALGPGRAPGHRGGGRRGVHRPDRQAHPVGRQRRLHQRAAARAGAPAALARRRPAPVPKNGRGLALRRAKSDAGQIRCHKCTSCQRRQPRYRHERSDPA